MTKTYLRKVCQNEQLLPDGPLLLSPASLASAFHQEVTALLLVVNDLNNVMIFTWKK